MASGIVLLRQSPESFDSPRWDVDLRARTLKTRFSAKVSRDGGFKFSQIRNRFSAFRCADWIYFWGGFNSDELLPYILCLSGCGLSPLYKSKGQQLSYTLSYHDPILGFYQTSGDFIHLRSLSLIYTFSVDINIRHLQRRYQDELTMRHINPATVTISFVVFQWRLISRADRSDQRPLSRLEAFQLLRKTFYSFLAYINPAQRRHPCRMSITLKQTLHPWPKRLWVQNHWPINSPLASGFWWKMTQSPLGAAAIIGHTRRFFCQTGNILDRFNGDYLSLWKHNFDFQELQR